MSYIGSVPGGSRPSPTNLLKRSIGIKKAFPSGRVRLFLSFRKAHNKKPSPRGAPVGGISEGQGGSRFRRGEGVDQRETDEGSAFPIDIRLGEAVSSPRIEEMPRTLCLDDFSDKFAPHPTRHTPSHLPPEGKAYIIQNTKCFP